MSHRASLSVYLFLAAGSCAIASCSAPPGSSQGTTGTQTEALAAATANANVTHDPSPPKGYVFTPGGYVHNSCVHAVANNARIDHAGHVYENGVLTATYGQCPYPRIELSDRSGADGEASAPIPNAPIPSDGPHSWLFTHQSPPAGQFWTGLYSEQTVPEPPKSEGQTIFYWNGLEANDKSWLGQPVLQWGPSQGPGGGNYWAIASWVILNGQAIYTNLVTVNSGDSILFYIFDETAQSDSDDDLIYIITEDETQGKSVTLPINLDAAFWRSPGLFAIPAALEYNNTPNCPNDVDVPTLFFTDSFLYAGTVHPPSYNQVKYSPANTVQGLATSCTTVLCSPANYPCWGLSGSETLLGM